ncbi:AraC family transcriptional regulator [Chitinophaga silvatica]|uniref:AraC family transcriptional regulator n=1 Tax=Chitinophaga silvatica TaxID=2282649 RepID=A0A3E1Y8I9_9BACT|nr:AraC family transcriptional regulator [Chitinophaga silvatica]RFS21759.1 AraC family transcriptional regulator [Chitinophaga silvatica]
MSEDHNYINYSCYFNAFREGEQFVLNHSLSMIVSGEMELNDGTVQRVFKKGDVYLARKNQLLKFMKKPTETEEFKSLSIQFGEDLLKAVSAQEGFHLDEKYKTPAFINLSDSQHLRYFMESLLQYKELLENKAPELLELKQKEALMLLFAYDKNLKKVLFDFSEPHKLNLEEFMQKNYHFNVKLERFAYLTGRSLATFKRDFKKIFNTSPRNWLQQRRLQEAYFLITQKRQRPNDIYMDLGFEDLSHFSFTFKKQFGHSPSELLK